MKTDLSDNSHMFQVTGEATSHIDLGPDTSPITVIANEAIRRSMDANCIQQAVNARLSPGVSQVVLNPDAHLGYGAPVGCVMVSPTHVYPGPVGVDIKCSMSFLQTDLPEEAVQDVQVRKQLIREIARRIPTGPGRGSRHVAKGRTVDDRLGRVVVTEGASKKVLKQLGIPIAWADRCEDAAHRAPDGSIDTLVARLETKIDRDRLRNFREKCSQLGSYGGGNHFGECEIVRVSDQPQMRKVAEVFGLKDGKVGFLSHCGSRGFGYGLATQQFAALKTRFKKTETAFPFGDSNLVYAEYGSPEGDSYLCDMAMGANFATVNHLLINALVLEAFQAVIPGTRGELVYFISHNIVRREPVDGILQWVHRKGATRAFPAGHEQLARTPFADTGHPILLPGNPRDGSAVMVALPGAEASCFSVNHGAGRRMSRTAAKKQLTQQQVERSLADSDILSNCREYPRDEAPAAYKDFEQVLASVRQAGLAEEVARLQARFVIKDGAPADD
jgi:tRNA-splicing ligase RtcB (3'-phosphate/5'-hydroxy nucleic acid ligase)